MRQRGETEARQLDQEHEARMAKFQTDHRALWDALESEWKAAMLPLCGRIEAIRKDAAAVFPGD